MARCADCGLLAFRNPETVTLEEVEFDVRTTGKFRSFRIGQGPDVPFFHGTEPQCFVRAFDLPKEVQEAKSEKQLRNLAVLQKERDCAHFCQWQQGSSPKEHKEMQLASDLKKWQEERLEADRKREEDRRIADRQHSEQQREKDRVHQERQGNKAFRRQLLMLFLGALLTALIGFLTGLLKREESKPIIIQTPAGPATQK